MAQTGAAMQMYNNELVKTIEDLRDRRDELEKDIQHEDEEKRKLQNDIRLLSERLAKINESLAKKICQRTEYDKTIAEAEQAYMKILESSQILLTVLKKESSSEQKKAKAKAEAVA